MKLKVYFTVWKTLAATELQHVFINRYSNIMFFIGKIMRMFMSLLFLFIIKANIDVFAGYTSDQLVIFFLTYQFVDVLAQALYRGVYLFSDKIKTGEFDFTLLKPISSLYLSLIGKPDVNDFVLIIPTTLISFWIVANLNLVITWTSFFWFIILLINSFLIATAFHILVLVVGILTTEVDGIVWMYRDLSSLGRFPVSIYMEPLRFALFFLIPVGMMITVPAEVLIGVAPSQSIAMALAIGISFFIVSLRLWKWSLHHYSSASS